MIRTVVFDIGHVLIGFDWRSYLNKLFAGRLSAGEIAVVAKAMFGSEYWRRLNSGTMETQDALHAMQTLAPGYESCVTETMDRLGECVERMEYAIPWIEEMKARGLQVLFLSDYPECLPEKAGQAVDFIPHMDGGVSSWEEKCTKPDERIYRILLKRYQLIPSECVFIDDKEDNIETARRLGMRGVKFTDYEQAHSEVNDVIRDQNSCFESGDISRMLTVKELCDYAAVKYSDRKAFVQFTGDSGSREITFKELADRVESLRAGLISEGLSGSHIAVIGETSIDWMILYIAAVSGCGVLVPIDKDLDTATIVRRINAADVEYIFCSDKCRSKIEEALSECSSVKKVFRLFCEDMPKGNAQSADLPIDPDKTCLILYTSGTTGANKGVMLTNRNILTMICGCNMLIKLPKSTLSVLPVSHAYELHPHILHGLYCGTTVYINDDMKYLIRSIVRSKAEMTCMVPMMIEYLVRVMQKEMKGSDRDKITDIRQAVFGDLRFIISGGALIKEETVAFLDEIGISTYIGYGVTECAPVLTFNPFGRIKHGSVGRVLPTIRMRVADKNTDGCGELQVSGDNVMKGYYKDPEATAGVFTKNGWFKTGDIGCIDEDEYVYLKGRKKNLIILSNGENVVPEEIEQMLYQAIPCIRECMVYAKDGAPGLTAEVYPDPEFCLEKGLINASLKKQFIQTGINAYNANMPGYRRICDIVVRESEFEKNSVQKIRRPDTGRNENA